MPDYILLVFSEQTTAGPIGLRLDVGDEMFGHDSPRERGLSCFSCMNALGRFECSGLSQSYLQSIATLVTCNCQNVLSTGAELANEGLRLIVLA
jgi:hypothetical protein